MKKQLFISIFLCGLQIIICQASQSSPTQKQTQYAALQKDKSDEKVYSINIPSPQGIFQCANNLCDTTKQDLPNSLTEEFCDDLCTVNPN